MVEKSGRRGVVAQGRGRLARDRYGWITSDSMEDGVLRAREGRRRCDEILGKGSEDAKGCAWAGQGWLLSMSRALEVSSRSEAKLQAKAQITAAVGSKLWPVRTG